MSWKVIQDFSDSLDNYHLYMTGDTFPRQGQVVSAQRIEELSTHKNAIGVPLIKADFQKSVKETRAKTKRKG